MKNVSLFKKLIAISIISSLITALVGMLGFLGISTATVSLDGIASDSIPSIIGLSNVKAGLIEGRRNETSLLIQQNPSKEEIARIWKIADSSLKDIREGIKLYEQTSLDMNEQAMWREFKPVCESWLAACQESFRLQGEGKKDQALVLFNGPGIEMFRKSRDLVSKSIAYCAENAKKSAKESLAIANRNTKLLGMAVLASVIISLTLSITVSRRIVGSLGRVVTFASAIAGGTLDQELDIRQADEVGQLSDSLRIMVATLKSKIAEAEEKSARAALAAAEAQEAKATAEQACRMAEQAKAEGVMQTAQNLQGVVAVVSSASEELSTQIDQSSRGSEEQSQRMAETASSMEEMNATVLAMAASASQATQTADQAKAKAEEGSRVVGRVVEGIGQVERQARELKADMATLGQQAEGIGQILNVISDIADQTNLLALNAAIEAARAGETGRGFAVVADEVRKLAEKTMTATKEVGEAIRGVQDAARRNVDTVERSGRTIEEATRLASTSGESLKEIVALVGAASDQARTIAAASQEQSSASEEINRSIEAVNRISTETARAMLQSSQAVTDLATQAQVLKGLIEEMQAESGQRQALTPGAAKAFSQGKE